ncbi:hypothetical protein BKG60_17015 [Mycobacterium syngnathidarum]|uniref:Dihydrodipicolinate reductase N-terminal domain-containing protein n=1 Tax=Mycobacterium syngnathidarum TaxID=1908205 RepID=A0A1S1K6I1_9MYCO|nr:hypothetical protein BKG61_10935 [Mycobacterium syngnathidarum]OLT95523.1 hypothetical protein BKG60_17015 [Mycobacterium syngnathidarum]
MTYRVVQWTTGNVGRKSVHAIVANADLELVGCYAWAPDKVGKDVGELCGTEPLVVAATDDVDALLALQPDSPMSTTGPHPRPVGAIAGAAWPGHASGRGNHAAFAVDVQHRAQRCR